MMHGARQSKRVMPTLQRQYSSGESDSVQSERDDEEERDIGPSSPTHNAGPSTGAPWDIRPQDPTDPQPAPSLHRISTASTIASSVCNPPQPTTNSQVYPTPQSSRFRSSVQRLIRMRRMTESKPGAEPGIDPTKSSAKSEYGHIVQECKIDVITYGASKSSFVQYGNAAFLRYLEEEQNKQKEVWEKVRWINVHGIDWSIVRALAIAYGLHPLAVEDVLHTSLNKRTKSDYYPSHVFVQGVVLLLDDDEGKEEESDTFSDIMTDDETTKPNGKGTPSRRWHSKHKKGPENSAEQGQAPTGTGNHHRHPNLRISKARREATMTLAMVNKLKGDERVKVKTSNLYMFLFRDGTFITMHEDPDSTYDEPIKTRLHSTETLLRTTGDASVLLQSMLDLMADHAIQVVDTFQAKLWEMERDTLLKPNTESVRTLHMLSADITFIKRTLTPFKALVYGMRRYDLDRAIALQTSADNNTDPKTVEGFISHQAKVYLADVLDHTNYVLTSLEMFETVTENLISYSFNLLSYEMNEVMRRLTLATVIFFPLTFLTGYFGMNFTSMTSIEGSDLFFWKVALPSLFAIIVYFLWEDIVKMVKYLRKRSIRDRYSRKVKSASKAR